MDAPDALLSFTLGPVQSFIAGARTVRDLWTGSFLLSWLTQAAMRPLRDAGPEVVFLLPALDDPLTAHQHGLPNRFTALVPAGRAADLARDCELACRQEWEAICRNVHEALTAKGPFRALDVDWDRLWGAQVGSFFDIHTAWLPLRDCTPEACARLLQPMPADLFAAQMEVLAGLVDARKACRPVPAYRPSPDEQGRFPPKCSLLGTYEQMGPAGLDSSRAFWAEVAKWRGIGGSRVRERERLCALSLVKRFAWSADLSQRLPPRKVRFSDTATVAASLWLRQGEALEPDDVRRRYDDWSGPWLHWQKPDQDKDEEACPPDIWAHIQRKKARQGKPPTYYAILMLDGDRLGKQLRGEARDASWPAGPERPLAISRALMRFSREDGPRIVEEVHHGALIYAGGDDVLALLPTQEVIGCAADLAQAYRASERMGPGGPEATVSAGIAVVHYKEDLRFAVETARAAEDTAKRAGRNALAVTVCKRSGEHATATLAWEHTPALGQLVVDFLAGVSDRWTYQLQRELPTLAPERGLVLVPREAAPAEVRRLLRRLEGLRQEKAPVYEALVLNFLESYREEMTKPERRPRETGAEPKEGGAQEAEEKAKAEARALRDFVTLCQTASFLARGRDE